MPRPLAALGLAPLGLAPLGLALGLLASQAALAQSPPSRPDCIATGMVSLGAFTAQPVVGERGPDPNLNEYAVTLRALRPLRIASVSLRAGGLATPGLQVELPVGQDIRVALGRRQGQRLSDSELRSGLRVSCMAA